MTIQTTRELERIDIIRTVDTDADTSYIGEYSNSPGPEDRTIDRKARGDAGSRGYRYFIAAMSGEETGNAESVEQDYKRMESLNRGDWCFYGIGVRAVLKIDEGNGHSRFMNIESTSLWGIESDGDTAYTREVANDQLAEIIPELMDLGISQEAIDAAIQNAEFVDA